MKWKGICLQKQLHWVCVCGGGELGGELGGKIKFAKKVLESKFE